MNPLAGHIAAALASGTVLALAGLGLLVNERVGVVNLGAEGLMLLSAITGYAIAMHTGSAWLAFVGGALAAALLVAVYGWIVIWLNSNQYAQYAGGLAVSLLGAGLSAYLGQGYVGRPISVQLQFAVPGLSDVPFLGEAVFRQHPMVYLTILLVPALWFLFWRTRTGLILRAIGESPDVAHALGYRVRWIRFAAVVLGGVLCGLAGTYLSVGYLNLWSQGMVAGQGWIALSLTVFATWRPARLLLGAYLFGAVAILKYPLQTAGVAIPVEFLNMLPYLSTILVLVLISRNPAWIRLNMPASLGKPFFPTQ